MFINVVVICHSSSRKPASAVQTGYCSVGNVATKECAPSNGQSRSHLLWRKAEKTSWRRRNLRQALKEHHLRSDSNPETRI